MKKDTQAFQETVWAYYQQHGRALPWRTPKADGGFDPYKILVSEIMLQQTQVSRVIPKYHSFLAGFPNLKALAEAPLSAVLAEWSGLGYNRRAKYLHQAAKTLVPKISKVRPWALEDLVACKGIGPNTAAAVLVYAYNRPLAFIETNIRTVFIHHFFPGKTDVSDKEILPLIKQTLDSERPREWHWALMDYGSYLKATVGNASRSSKHYARQSKFAGSKRQVRGQVLKLLRQGARTRQELMEHVSDERLEAVMNDLLGEGLISKYGAHFRLG